jgi:hypothetical protein
MVSLLLGLAGCHDSSPGISVNIAAQFRDSAGGGVDLAKSYEADWDRVCSSRPTPATPPRAARWLRLGRRGQDGDPPQ